MIHIYSDHILLDHIKVFKFTCLITHRQGKEKGHK